MRLVGGLGVLGLTVMVLLVAWPSATLADVDPDRLPIPSTPAPTPPPTPSEQPVPDPSPDDPSDSVDEVEEGAKGEAQDQAESAKGSIPRSAPPPAEEPAPRPPVDEAPEEPPVDPAPSAPIPDTPEDLSHLGDPIEDSGPLPDLTDDVQPELAAIVDPPLPAEGCSGSEGDAPTVPVAGIRTPGPRADDGCGKPQSMVTPTVFVPAEVDWTGPRGASPLPFVAKAALVALTLALLRFLGLGFTRLAHPDVAGHPHRARILEFVQHNPGAGETAVARALGLRRATARHHVDKLRQFGMVTIKEFRGRPSLFLPSHGNPQVQRGAAALRRGPAQRAYQLLRESPGLDQEALGERLGLSQQRTSQILRNLREAELVLAERVGARHRYKAVELPHMPAAAASS